LHSADGERGQHERTAERLCAAVRATMQWMARMRSQRMLGPVTPSESEVHGIHFAFDLWPPGSTRAVRKSTIDDNWAPFAGPFVVGGTHL